MKSAGVAGETAPDLVSPVVPGYAVARPALENRLDACLDRQLGVVVAPPGSGKSVLIGQWLANRGEVRSAWLSIDSADNDPRRLAPKLVDAFRAPHRGSVDDDELGSGTRRLGRAFIDALIEEMRGDEPRVVVLDDFHLLTNSDTIDDVAVILGQLPRNMHVVVAARSDPRLRLHDHRVRGELVELRQDALAFDPDDAAIVLERVAGRTLQPEHVRALVERTEGWAAGLQLAGLSLRSTEDDAAFVAAFAGDDRFVADYLTAEVLSRQSAEIKDFLLRTSVLTRLSGELCDALTERDDSQQVLDALDRDQLFLIPLDRQRQWFRYHHLFGDLLRYHLRAAEPATERLLQSRAGEWLVQRGDLVDAQEYFLAAGDWTRARRLADAHGRSLFENGEADMLHRWYFTIAAATELPDVPLSLDLMAAQSMADRPALAEETYARLLRRTDLTVAERVSADVIYSTLGGFDLPPETVLAATDRALEALPTLGDDPLPDVLAGLGDAPSLDAVARVMRGRALFWMGDVTEALGVLTDACDRPGLSYPIWKVHGYGSAGLVHAWLGHLTRAQALASEAISVAREASLFGHVSMADAYFALALVAIERDENDQAALMLREAWVRSERGHRATSLDLHRLLQARLEARVSGPRDALATLQGPSAGARPRPLWSTTATILEIRLLLALDESVLAATVRRRSDLDDLAGVVSDVDLALASGDLPTARRRLDAWPVPLDAPHELVARLLSEGELLAREEQHAAASETMLRAIAVAEDEGIRRPFLDAGPEVSKLLRGLRRRHTSGFLRSITDDVRTEQARRAASERLVDPLTDRELAVLRYLPSRLANTDIAAELFVSPNTLKTHLRNIYRKLEVTDRDGAIERAGDFGLL